MGRESSQWQSRGWSFRTSVDPAVRFSGVAVLIRNTIANTDCIRYQELVKGRLLHVRLFPSEKVTDPGCSVDILCLYQHLGDDQVTLQGGRQRVWVSLSRYLASLPQEKSTHRGRRLQLHTSSAIRSHRPWTLSAGQLQSRCLRVARHCLRS